MTATQTNNAHKPTSGQVGEPTKPLVVKYTTHLPADVIKWVKREALEREIKDYQLVQLALTAYRNNQEAA